ncbi:hypothetical protein Pfo_011347 [Paulownia fortunei]|nr:hypothetical protein Pfo_011347 [Paulownia fortunei]
MAGSCIRIFLVVLCFSYLICKNGAIPFTRSRNLIHKPQNYEVAKRVLLGNFEESWKMMDTTIRRMEIEVNDYPGSGANNRHTPRKSTVGTPAYIAPEVLSRREYDGKNEIGSGEDMLDDNGESNEVEEHMEIGDSDDNDFIKIDEYNINSEIMFPSLASVKRKFS